MGVFIGWVFFSILVGLFGSNTRAGFGWAFFISLILSPIIGIIVVLFLGPKSPEIKAQQEKEKQILIGKYNPPKASYSDELLKLKSLLDSGLISREDFDREKSVLDSRTQQN